MIIRDFVRDVDLPETADVVIRVTPSGLAEAKIYGKGTIGGTYNHTKIIQEVIDDNTVNSILVIGDFYIDQPIKIDKSIEIIGRKSKIITKDLSKLQNSALIILESDDITIRGLTFYVKGNNNLSDPGIILIRKGDKINILRNIFIAENYYSFLGPICLDGQVGIGNISNIKISDNIFNTDGRKTIHILPYNYTINNLDVCNNLFISCKGINVFLNAYNYLYNVKIVNNRSYNTYGSFSEDLYGTLCHAGLAKAYMIYNLDIRGNIFYTKIGERQSFVMLYQLYNANVSNNIAIADEGSNPVMFIALGQTDNPIIRVNISNNIVYGFNSTFDWDSTIGAEVHDNIFIKCGEGCKLGYGIQKYNRVYNNVFINCTWQGSLNALSAIALNDSSPVKCEIYNNLIIDEEGKLKYVITLMGNYDYSDVIIRDNRIYAPQSTLEFLHINVSGAIPPKRIENIEVHDSTGKKYTNNGGLVSFSGDGSTTQFKISHGLVTTPKVVVVTPKGSTPKPDSIDWDDTYIYINYSTAPASGTSLVFSWYVEV